MKKSRAIIVLAALACLSACTSVKQELGVGRNSPDEFTVVKRAPLSLPPDYALRPPVDATLQASSDAPVAARETLLGPAAAPSAPESADTALLEKMGATRADPAIRAAINRDNGYIALKSRTVADKLIFWKDAAPSEDKAPSSVVDAPAEAARLKKNRQEGKPADEGKVPVIEKKQSTIDKIF